MNTPKISIIVPVYNVEQYLPHCIDSILVQSFTDFELLLIDDGSKDKSGEICDEYVEKDSRVKVFHKENGGVSSARNVGIEASNGEWICFVDSDDYVKTEWLENYAQYTDSDLQIQGYVLVSPDTPSKDIILQDTFLIGEKRFDINYSDINLNVPWKCFRARIIHDNHLRFPIGMHSAEDLVFVLNFMKYSNTMRLLPYNGYVYNRFGSVLTNSFSKYSTETIISWFRMKIHVINALFQTSKSNCLYKSIITTQYQIFSWDIVFRYAIATEQERFEMYGILKDLHPYVDFIRNKKIFWILIILIIKACPLNVVDCLFKCLYLRKRK